jgi:hypothetical protein
MGTINKRQSDGRHVAEGGLAFINYGDQLMYLTILAICSDWGLECDITTEFDEALKKLKAAKNRAAGVFFLQGYYFGDPFKYYNLIPHANTMLQWCKSEGIFSAMLPQTAGSFSPYKYQGKLRRGVAKMYPLIDMIYLRDKAAIADVSEFLDGRRLPELVQDTVFSSYRPLITGVQKSARDIPLICFSISRKIKETIGKTFNAKIINLIELLTTNATLLLIPHEDSVKNADRSIVKNLFEKVRVNNNRTHVLDVPARSVAKIEEEIANCDMMVTMRYHALILAARDATPVVAFSWAPKYADLLQRLGLDESRAILSLDDLDATVRKIWAVYDNRTAISKDMRIRVTGIARSVDEAYNRLRKPLFDAFHKRNGLVLQGV